MAVQNARKALAAVAPLTLSGTVAATALHATLTGSADQMDFLRTVHGSPL